MVATIVDAKFTHIGPVADNIRPADRLELLRTGHRSPHRAIRCGIQHSEVSMTGLWNDEPVLIFGVRRHCLMSRKGSPWMVASSRIDENPITTAFLKRCRKPLVDFLRYFDILENYVDTENRRAIRWLMYMGFNVEEVAVEYGPYKALFHRFELCADQS